MTDAHRPHRDESEIVASEDVPRRVEIARPAPTAKVTITDSLRAALAGATAAKLLSSSAALFDAGGKRILSETTQKAVRLAAERGAARAIAVSTGPILQSAAAIAKAPPALASAAPVMRGAKDVALGTAARQAIGLAGKEILKGAGKAAGIGFVLDGAVAGFEAVVAVRNGSTDRETALKHVAKEATTGALATGAGVLLGAGLVALTGGIAAPVVFAVGAIGSIGTKRWLRRVTS